MKTQASEDVQRAVSFMH